MSSADEFERAQIEAVRKRYEARFNKLTTDLSVADMAKQEFKDAVPQVAAEMVKIAMHDPNSRTRMDAAKYILNVMVYEHKTTQNELVEYLKELGQEPMAPSAHAAPDKSDADADD